MLVLFRPRLWLAIFGMLLLLCQQCMAITVGAERFNQYKSLLKDKDVGLIVNQTSMVGDIHLADFLLANGITVTTLFAPEHGIRGDHDAGASIESGKDIKTGLPVVSIYGKYKKPTAQALANVDVLVFDIQDVGVRYYTYISSMHYMMEAAAGKGKKFIVLDRPNPNGAFVDGPVLDPAFSSFVGMHPIPVLHGMTVGELAQMINGEGWLSQGVRCNLSVVPVKNYQRQMSYSLPVRPSPNLPNDVAVGLYPSLGFFEGTAVSIGRGTDFPFQVIGHDQVAIGDFSFTPRSIPGVATHPKLQGKRLTGTDLHNSPVRGLHLDFLTSWYAAFAEKELTFFSHAAFFDKLAGTDQLRKVIIAGQSAQQIKKSWQKDIEQFLQQRRDYLLYQ